MLFKKEKRKLEIDISISEYIISDDDFYVWYYP